MAGNTTTASATPVRDKLSAEIKAAVSQIAPTLPPVQRMMLTTAVAAVGGMREDMARALAIEIVKLGSELREVLAASGVPNGGMAA